MYHLYLDDVRGNDGHDIVICRDYNSFIETIDMRGLPLSISFDHDLGAAKDGFDCAQWLINYCIKNRQNLPEWSIHSSNPVGKKEIKSVLETFAKHFKF